MKEILELNWLRKKRDDNMEDKKFFERNKKLVNRFTRNFLAKNKIGIVHGTRATNVQLPTKLNRKTTDWDVFVSNPKLRARQLERILDKKYGGDYFKVKKGVGSPGVRVWKVKSNISDKGLVDFATANREVPSVAVRGVRFATLEDQKKIAEQNVKKIELKFRREKDKDLLKRINKATRRRRWL